MKNINLKEFARGLLFIIGYMFIIQIIVVFIFAFFNLSLQNNFNYMVACLLIYLITLIILVGYYWQDLKEEFILYKNNFREFFKISMYTWIKALVFMLISNSLIVSITGDIASNESANRSLLELYPIFSVLTMVIIGPFIEEMLFRKNLDKVFNNKKAFLILSGVMFGLAHVINFIDISSWEAFLSSAPQLLFIIPYGGMGYFFAEAYYDTKSIFTSVTTHTIHNAFAVALQFLIGI